LLIVFSLLACPTRPTPPPAPSDAAAPEPPRVVDAAPAGTAAPVVVDPEVRARAATKLRRMAQDIRERVVGVSTMEELDQWKVSVDAIAGRMRWAWRGVDGFDAAAFREDVAWLTGLHGACEAIRLRAPGGCDPLSQVGNAALERCKDALGFWGLLVGSMARPRRCDVALARVTAPLVGADVDGVLAACRATVEGLATCADDEVCRDRATAIQDALGPSPPGEDPEEAMYRALSKGRIEHCSDAVERAYDGRMSKWVMGAPSVPHEEEEE
jgi:hypothetical protein